MNEELLVKIVLENAHHIKIMNGELAGVLAQVSLHTKLIFWQLGMLGTLLIANVVHMWTTRK